MSGAGSTLPTRSHIENFSSSVSAGVSLTVLSVTGVGVVRTVVLSAVNNLSNSFLKIDLDGETLSIDLALLAQQLYGNQGGGTGEAPDVAITENIPASNTIGVVWRCNLSFETSAVVQLRRDGAAAGSTNVRGLVIIDEY